MISEVRDTPIYRFGGRLLDVSLIWGLEQTAEGHVWVNGVRMMCFCPEEDYIKLEKKFFSYRGWNYDR